MKGVVVLVLVEMNSENGLRFVEVEVMVAAVVVVAFGAGQAIFVEWQPQHQ